MSKFIEEERTIDEWKDLVEDMQRNTINILYNFMVFHYDGDFDNIPRKELSDILHINPKVIDYVIDYYLQDNSPYKTYMDYYEDKQSNGGKHEEKQ